MILIVLGFILLGVATFVFNANNINAKFSGPLKAVAIVLIGIGVLNACLKQIDAGQVGVKSLFGIKWFKFYKSFGGGENY
jgi:membrane protein CcdC involved in cytochrome C biogenesis